MNVTNTTATASATASAISTTVTTRPIPNCIKNAILIPFCDGQSPWILDPYQYARTVVANGMVTNTNPCGLRKCMLKSIDQTYILVGERSAPKSFTDDLDPEWNTILTNEQLEILKRERCIPLGVVIVNFYDTIDGKNCTVEWIQTLIQPGFGVFRTIINKLSILLNMYLMPGEVCCSGGPWARGEKVWRKYLGDYLWEKVLKVGSTNP